MSDLIDIKTNIVLAESKEPLLHVVFSEVGNTMNVYGIQYLNTSKYLKDAEYHLEHVLSGHYYIYHGQKQILTFSPLIHGNHAHEKVPARKIWERLQDLGFEVVEE